MTKKEIVDYLSRHKKDFQKQYGITKLALFGSYSRDEATTQSDIDILFAVNPNRPFSLFSYLRLQHALEEALEHKVDLVREETLKSALKPYVYKDIIDV